MKKYADKLDDALELNAELLACCKVTVRDIENNINPYLEGMGAHPITQTLEAMKQAIAKAEAA
jgi:hypothetical protein